METEKWKLQNQIHDDVQHVECLLQRLTGMVDDFVNWGDERLWRSTTVPEIKRTLDDIDDCLERLFIFLPEEADEKDESMAPK